MRALGGSNGGMRSSGGVRSSGGNLTGGALPAALRGRALRAGPPADPVDNPLGDPAPTAARRGPIVPEPGNFAASSFARFGSALRRALGPRGLSAAGAAAETERARCADAAGRVGAGGALRPDGSLAHRTDLRWARAEARPARANRGSSNSSDCSSSRESSACPAASARAPAVPRQSTRSAVLRRVARRRPSPVWQPASADRWGRRASETTRTAPAARAATATAGARPRKSATRTATSWKSVPSSSSPDPSSRRSVATMTSYVLARSRSRLSPLLLTQSTV